MKKIDKKIKKNNKKIFEEINIAIIVIAVSMKIDLIIPKIKKVISPIDFDFCIIAETKRDELVILWNCNSCLIVLKKILKLTRELIL